MRGLNPTSRDLLRLVDWVLKRSFVRRAPAVSDQNIVGSVQAKMLWGPALFCILPFSLIPLDLVVCLDDALVGHLKPFGQHREPDVVTEERETVPHPSKFWESYVSQNKPVVFRGAAKHSRYIVLKERLVFLLFMVNLELFLLSFIYYFVGENIERNQEVEFDFFFHFASLATSFCQRVNI